MKYINETGIRIETKTQKKIIESLGKPDKKTTTIPSKIFKSDEDVEKFFMDLIDNDWNVNKTCELYNIKKSALIMFVKSPNYKKYLDIASDTAKLLFLSGYMEGVLSKDTNVKIRFINKAPDTLLKELFNLNNIETEQTINNSNQIML